MMAEALAIIGLVSAIVQFVDFGSKVVNRLNEFQVSIDDVPETYRDIQAELPLLLVTLNRTKGQAEDGYVSKVTQETLRRVVDGCRSQVELLNDTLVKTLPGVGDSSWRRGVKAFSSVRQEKKVQQITTRLRNYISTLTFYQTTGLSKVESKTETVTIIPFSRNPNFVGREGIFDELDERFASRQDTQPKAALCGLGGVGYGFCMHYRFVGADL